MNDKEIERQRYDERADMLRQSSSPESILPAGAASISSVFRAPYDYYESTLEKILRPDSVVLEIGSGTGEFTEVLLRSGAHVVASDISAQSLEILRLRYPEQCKLTTITCDMENLNFPDATFDVVTSAGSLSYGDNQLVLMNIKRVIKPGGCFVCVDSLNHNPVYRINRYIHYLRGSRSFATLQRMPKVALISQYQNVLGGESHVRYFGGITWLIMIFARFSVESFWVDISDRFDRLFGVRKSAFKFVLMVKNVI